MPITAADIQLASRLADAAGAAIRPYFRAEHGVELKDDHSPVTRADREAEAAMRKLLDAEAPGDGVIGEEYGEKPGVTGRQWVLDPIDGTRSFTVGRAIFGTLIALVEDGWPLLGIIDQPVQRERWLGVAGRPTTFNGKPARTRTCAQLEGAVLATTSPHLFGEGDVPHYMALVATPVAGVLAFVDVGDAKSAACGPVLSGATAKAQRTTKGEARDDVGRGTTAKAENGKGSGGEKKEQRKKFLGIF